MPATTCCGDPSSKWSVDVAGGRPSANAIVVDAITMTPNRMPLITSDGSASPNFVARTAARIAIGEGNSLGGSCVGRLRPRVHSAPAQGSSSGTGARARSMQSRLACATLLSRS